MFFISISKKKVTDGPRLAGVEEFIIDSLVFRIVTDAFLSKLIITEEGFSIVESPLLSRSGNEGTIFSEVTYKKNEKCLAISKTALSGRPIYYSFSPEGEFACSTHISMLRKAGIEIEENRKLLPDFFVYRFITPPQTLYKNIRQLVSGGRLEIEFTGDHFRIRQCGELIPPVPGNSDAHSTIETISEETLDLLMRSCHRLTPLHDEIIVLLSGGLDSSILFKVCQKLFAVHTTFSTGYPFENANDNIEREYAMSAARTFGIHHNYYESSETNFLRGFLQAILSAEEPLQHLQSVLLFLLFKYGLPKGKGIVVSGQGADAMFGPDLHDCLSAAPGRNDWWIGLLSRYPFVNLVKGLSHLTGRGSGIVRRLYWNSASRAPLDDIDHIAWEMDKYGDINWVCGYFNVSFKDIVLNRYSEIKSVRGRSMFDILSIVSLFGSIAVTQSIWSKLGEAQGKILFYPYTDPELVKYAYRMPWNIKLVESKYVLRSVGRRLSIPEHIISRPKSSFGIHPARWAESGGIFEPLIPLAAKVFDKKQMRLLQSTEHSKAMTFWNILNYAIWKRICIDNEPLAALEEELTQSIARQRSVFTSDYRSGTVPEAL